MIKSKLGRHQNSPSSHHSTPNMEPDSVLQKLGNIANNRPTSRDPAEMRLKDGAEFPGDGVGAEVGSLAPPAFEAPAGAEDTGDEAGERAPPAARNN